MAENRSIPEQTMVVILAAGKGTRMGRSDLVKVCFEIDSVPAINRQIDVYKKLRFRRFLIVVGTMADQVLQTVDKAHPGLMYAFQDPPRGTGHAAKIAAEALQNIGYEGYVLVAAGDSYIQPEAIQSLLDGYVKQQADMALLFAPIKNSQAGSLGRVLVAPDGQALDIVESLDLARQAIVDQLKPKLARRTGLQEADILGLIEKHIPDARKQQVAVGDLLALAKRGGAVNRERLAGLLDSDAYNIRIDGKRLKAEEIERTCRGVNQSLYLFRSDVFYQGVGMIDNDNAQGEFYLTDAVRHLSSVRNVEGERSYRVRAVELENREWLQSFNSPDELLAIQDYVRRRRRGRHGATATGERPKLKGNQYGTVRQWLAKIEARRAPVTRWMRRIYGSLEELHAEKARDLARVLKCFGKRFGFDEKVCIVRAPGRVNLMGRHVDHRGGMTNFLAIDRETVAVVGLRDDHRVVAVNTESKKFSPIEFNVPELIGRFAWSDWLNFVNSDWVRSMLHAAPGEWGHYIKAAMLRLQHRFQDVKIRGVNMAFCGNVPIAAGLSSSSTIVVATLQAAIALNQFELTSQQFIDLCGEGEWFVGSRGGAGDHAAIYLGQRGRIAQVGYLPFRVERILDAPRDYQVIIANSHVKAAKSSTAKHTFNARIADYNLGLELFRQRSPQIADAVEYIRDIYPEKLGSTTSDIYRMLLKVPERMTRKGFEEFFSGERRRLLESNFATHVEPEFYSPRGVLLYGIAEIVRSRMCADLLEANQLDVFGRQMKISHDGDRVSRYAGDGKHQPFQADVSDGYLLRLIDDLGSEDPDRVLGAQLCNQPGSYACSTPEIDRMADVASSVPGVAGAQIAGAGLGGCLMVLARKEAVGAVRRALVREYYQPAGLKPAVLPCIAVEGAGLVEF